MLISFKKHRQGMHDVIIAIRRFMRFFIIKIDKIS